MAGRSSTRSPSAAAGTATSRPTGWRSCRMPADRKSTRLNSSHTEIYTLSLHDALPILIAMTHGRAQQHTITVGGSRDGDIQAYRLEIVQDAGAYVRAGGFLPMLTRLMTTGPYDIPRAESVASIVVTSTTPIGAYRGAGRPEAAAALDRAIDLFAAEAGLDP